ncbi:MAG: 8-amino-7-oxononanoate synthase [Planctomycetaceae bacterium]|nr:8-amino-7-oxononanoate synthase [Planctomycetaceae bacterium]
MQKFTYYQQELKDLTKQDMLRACRCVDSAQGPVVRMADGSEKVLFCSNNYLGLAGDERVRQAAIDAIERYGVGAAAARLVSGTMRPHAELEEAMAAWLGKEAALYLPSGWAANQALLSTLPQKGDLVMLDKMDHASIIDPAKVSMADFHTYRKGQTERLEGYLSGAAGQKFVVTESVFSMDGDRADLKELVRLRNAYDAILVVDEAHSIGCFGATAAGLCEEEGMLADVDIVVAPLGKAFGASGGIVAGPKVLIDYLVNKARPFIYTTATPPAIPAAALKALEIIQSEPERRKQLTEKAAYLRNALKGMGLDTKDSRSQIIPVILGTPQRAVEVSHKLYEQGYLVVAIRPPTVPPGTARLRISMQADHTTEQIDGLIAALKAALVGMPA